MSNQSSGQRTESAFWFVMLLSSPGLFFVVLGAFLLLWQATGIGYGALDQRLRLIGLERAFGYALGWGYVWGIIAPLPIGLSFLVACRAEFRNAVTVSQTRFMRIAIALSVVSWLIFAGYWLAQM